MKVNAISFKGIYKATNQKFSPEQYRISENIKNQLTSPFYMDKDGNTINDNLKLQGYDTIISPADDDMVEVNLVTDFKKGNGMQSHLYKDSLYVGTYDKDIEFRPHDIDSAIKHKNTSPNIWLPLLLLSLFTFIGSTIKHCSNNNTDAAKTPITENTVTKNKAQNNVKTFSIDKLKVIRK